MEKALSYLSGTFHINIPMHNSLYFIVTTLSFDQNEILRDEILPVNECRTRSTRGAGYRLKMWSIQNYCRRSQQILIIMQIIKYIVGACLILFGAYLLLFELGQGVSEPYLLRYPSIMVMFLIFIVLGIFLMLIGYRIIKKNRRPTINN